MSFSIKQEALKLIPSPTGKGVSSTQKPLFQFTKWGWALFKVYELLLDDIQMQYRQFALGRLTQDVDYVLKGIHL